MKHTYKVTAILIAFFLLAQFLGLLIINQYIDHKKSIEIKETVMKPLPLGIERPEVENKSTSYILIIISILVGTGFALLIVKYNKPLIWKIMFFFSVTTTLTIAFGAFINYYAAAVIALILAGWRLYRPNVYIQNLSEIFIYGGLAAFFVNIFNLFSAFMMLIVISIYDFIAVYKTKHMVKLATFQSSSKVFAGLMIPYEAPKTHGKKHESGRHEKIEIISSPNSSEKTAKSSRTRVAILGGGDVGFTLIFAGVVMKDLMLTETVLTGFLKTLIIPLFASIALLYLLMKGEKNKFYPAMPILSFGCLVGYLVVWII
ncbi:MAG TPA: presenilin family intramembrane aspartyl protease [Candidatus Nanoarchaeia archaeon]|nr:presenilin family intramembrane aspartyl protease [Candidatus Nanoarchaeia archaeon]